MPSSPRESTGAQMAASWSSFASRDAQRPAIVTLFPSRAYRRRAGLRRERRLLARGADAVRRLGACMLKCVLRRANPAVGLLSIGEEPERECGHQGDPPAPARLGPQLHRQRRGRDLPDGGTEHQPVASSSATASSAMSSSILRGRRTAQLIDTLRKAGGLQGGSSSRGSGISTTPSMAERPSRRERREHHAHGKSSPRAIKNSC